MSLRERYMNKEITFEEYYGALVEVLGETAIRRMLPGGRSPEEWQALIREDEHLNNVPLRQWDELHHYIASLVSRAHSEVKEITGRGGWSLSDSVCVAKTAARRFALDKEELALKRVRLNRTWSRNLADGSTITATGRYYVNHPQISDGFSLTGEHLTVSGRLIIAGAIHDEILKYMPDLEPLVAVHLCAPDGTPMHARENGWFFYSGMATTYKGDHNPEGLSNTERAARALHIPAEELPEGMTTDEFERFVDGLASRWLEMADAARKIMEA